LIGPETLDTQLPDSLNRDVRFAPIVLKNSPVEAGRHR
jgi:hypothetical protein